MPEDYQECVSLRIHSVHEGLEMRNLLSKQNTHKKCSSAGKLRSPSI